MSRTVASHPFVLATAILALAVVPVWAQRASVLRVAAAPRVDADSALSNDPVQSVASRIPRALGRLPLWSAPIASAIVPGLGQAMLHKDRFVAYMAAEGFLILQYVKNTREVDQSSKTFMAIARDIARRNFVITPGAVPPDSVWKYYESMEKYMESGFFSMTPSGATVPESDTLTFNGYQWLLARQRYGVPIDDPGASTTPNYGQAVAYYETRAVGQAYRWSWRNAQLQRDLYGRAISRRNDASRQAGYDLTAIIANHVLSTIDAFANVRLIQATSDGLRFSASIPVR
jgi:hypothetical protein